jgi:hypothetical protein
MQQYEKEKQVPYITSVERHGMEREKCEGLLEGKREGLLEGIIACLKLRFGAEGAQLVPTIESLADIDRLQAILKRLKQPPPLMRYDGCALKSCERDAAQITRFV